MDEFNSRLESSKEKDGKLEERLTELSNLKKKEKKDENNEQTLSDRSYCCLKAFSPSA